MDLGSVLVLNLKLVLQHDHIPLALLVLHLRLESSAKRIEKISSSLDRLGGEETDPSESGNDSLFLRC